MQQLGNRLPLRTPLRDAAGRTVFLGDYFGDARPVLLVFGYYRCRTLCGVVFDDVLQALALSGTDGYRLVGISIDPTEGPADAAARLAGWRRALGDQPTPILLTGDTPPLAALARAAGFGYRYDRQLGQYQHPAFGLARQFPNHQALAGAGGKHENSWLTASPKMTDHGINGFALIGAESELCRHGATQTRWGEAF